MVSGVRRSTKAYWRRGGAGGWDIRVTQASGHSSGRLRWNDFELKNFLNNVVYDMPKELGKEIFLQAKKALDTVKHEGNMMGNSSGNISYNRIARSLKVEQIGKESGFNVIQGARIFPYPFKGDKSGPIASRMKGYDVTLPSLYNSLKVAWEYAPVFYATGAEVNPSNLFTPNPTNSRKENWFRPNGLFPGIGTGRRSLRVYDYIAIFEEFMDTELSKSIPRFMNNYMSRSSTFRKGPQGMKGGYR